MKKKQPVIEQLKQFLKTPYFHRNEWLTDNVMSVYVRKGVHKLSDGEIHNCLDIANIVVEQKHQRQGLFKKFVAESHELHPYDATYIENAHSPHLKAWLERQEDWHACGLGDCFCKYANVHVDLNALQRRLTLDRS